MIVISIAIVCVPRRIKYARELQQSLAPYPSIICVDAMMQGSRYGTERAWKAYLPGATHHMAIEEDVEVCQNFVETATKLATLVPDQIISLYSGKGDTPFMEKCKRGGKHWYVRKGTVPSGQAVMMPVPMILDFLRFSDHYVDKKIATHEDEPLWGYMETHNLSSWHTAPSIVEHVGAMDSALGYNNVGKTTPWYIGRETDGMSIDWTLGLSNPDIHHVKYTNPNCIRAWKGDTKYE